MQRVAIGVRMHSGWGALVAVSYTSGKVEVVDRRRIPVIEGETQGAKQPYHFAENLDLPGAEKFLASCFATAKHLAAAALRDCVDELRRRHFSVVGAAVLLASGRKLPNLSKILASHAMIHAAEGEFFRNVFTKAGEELGISVTGFRERDVVECIATAYRQQGTRLERQVSTLGRFVGPPWTQDQKVATLAAVLVLANKPR
jgi:hypothetical protein